MHKHKSKHVPTPLSCRKTRISIFMGTVNNILFPAHLSIMFRHNRYQPNIFDIIFINGSTIIHFTHYDLIVRTKPHFYFVACYWFRRPKCSMLRAHYYFKDWMLRWDCRPSYRPVHFMVDCHFVESIYFTSRSARGSTSLQSMMPVDTSEH